MEIFINFLNCAVTLIIGITTGNTEKTNTRVTSGLARRPEITTVFPGTDAQSHINPH